MQNQPINNNISEDHKSVSIIIRKGHNVCFCILRKSYVLSLQRNKGTILY